MPGLHYNAFGDDAVEGCAYVQIRHREKGVVQLIVPDLKRRSSSIYYYPCSGQPEYGIWHFTIEDAWNFIGRLCSSKSHKYKYEDFSLEPFDEFLHLSLVTGEAIVQKPEKRLHAVKGGKN